jgi:hypothetical protein
VHRGSVYLHLVKKAILDLLIVHSGIQPNWSPCNKLLSGHKLLSMCNIEGNPLWHTQHKTCAMLQVIHYDMHNTNHAHCCRWSIKTHTTQNMCNVAGDPLWHAQHKSCARLQVMHYDATTQNMRNAAGDALRHAQCKSCALLPVIH